MPLSLVLEHPLDEVPRRSPVAFAGTGLPVDNAPAAHADLTRLSARREGTFTCGAGCPHTNKLPPHAELALHTCGRCLCMRKLNGHHAVAKLHFSASIS